MAEKDKVGRVYPATFSCKLDDGSEINDHLLLEVRGHFRRGYCYLPPLKLIYDKNPASAFYTFKSVKLVSTCMTTWQDDQNLLKEYMIYKIYNMISDKSFRVRLLNLSYQDSSGKKKTITLQKRFHGCKVYGLKRTLNIKIIYQNKSFYRFYNSTP